MTQTERRKIPKNDRIQIRCNSELKRRYESALSKSGITMTGHLLGKIQEFVIYSERPNS